MIENMSISTKLRAAFSLLTVLVIALGALGIIGTQRMRDIALDIEQNWLPSIRYLGEMSTLTSRVTSAMLRHIQATDPALLDTIEKDMERFGWMLDEKRKLYEPLVASSEERALYETFQQEYRSFQTALEGVMELSRKGQKSQAFGFYESKGIGPRRAASTALDKLVALNDEGAARAQSESKGVFESTRMLGTLAMALGIVLSVLAALLIIRSVSRGIGTVVRPMQALAAGDLAVEIPYRGARTEIGTIADAVQVFKDGLIRMRALEQETELARASAAEQRRAAMRELATRFEQAVGGIVGTVSSSATQLQATAQQMTATAGATAVRSTTVAAAAEEAAMNVNTVAAAAEELGASVQEIGRQVDGSASLAQTAVEEAGRTAALVQELSSAVAKIGDVMTMISSIAGQTNLLALNATIEAARAGEAGRGFAVVAAEVKELANQTARATGEVGRQIEQIQSSTNQAVRAIGEISSRIREIAGVSTTIAAAVEQQGAATQEIVRNVAQAATGTGEVTSNITGVARASEDTGAAATQVLASASELSRQSEHLASEVGRFLDTVRAA